MSLYEFVFHFDEVVFYRARYEFADDSQALGVAHHLSGNCEIDLWDGERIVAQLKSKAIEPADAEPIWLLH